MKARAICAAVLISVTSSGQQRPAITPGASVNIEQLLEGPGGPRIVTEVAIGRIVEVLDPAHKELEPGYAEIFSERITEAGAVSLGERVLLVGVAASVQSRKASDFENHYLAADEVTAFSASLRAEAAFIASNASLPPLGQQYMQWRSKDGLLAIAGFANGNAGRHITSNRPNHPILGFTQEQFIELAKIADHGLETAKQKQDIESVRR